MTISKKPTYIGILLGAWASVYLFISQSPLVEAANESLEQEALAAPILQNHQPPAASSGTAQGALPAQIVIFGFENGIQGWQVPDWAKISNDYTLDKVEVSSEQACEGSNSLELGIDFPGGRWTGAYVEHQVEVTDWTPFGELSVDVYLPEDAPEGLKGKIILTVGEEWTWTEMNRAIALEPGKWTTLTVNLKPDSMDWKFFPEHDFRKIVRKIGVRVESNSEPVYLGPAFLDNVRLKEFVEPNKDTR